MPKLIPRKSVMVCNLSATPARYEEQSATIRPSSDLTKRPFQTRAGFKVGQSLSGLQFVADVIQVQPTQNGRGVFRVNQTSLPSNISTIPTQDVFPAAGQQAPWYSQS
jgi:hypothetical protein